MVMHTSLSSSDKKHLRRQVQYARKNLRGERALIVAIVAQGYLDALAGDTHAAAYFESNDYRHHLSLLGLPLCFKPEFL